MSTVLIVDDAAAKRSRLRAAIVACAGDAAPEITEADSLAAAKRAMRAHAFDLLVLDIALPRQSGGDIRRDGGLELLREIEERDGLHPPLRIIGVTAFGDVYELASEEFAQRLHHLISVEEHSDAWTDPFAAAVRLALDLSDDRSAAFREYRSELAIVCALRDPELRAVLDLPWNWSWLRPIGDATTYHRGCFRRGGEEMSVTAAAAPRMGMSAAAILAAKMIFEFRPRYIAIVGITAGVRGKAELGDILLADPSWDCGSGKWMINGGDVVFQQAPHQISVAPEIRDRIAILAEDPVHLAKIKSEFRGDSPSSTLRLLTGPVASNSAVLADGQGISRVVSQHRDALGVEMEAYGVMMAAEELGQKRPKALCLKAVVDFADGEKNDRFRRYGAYGSAQVLRVLFEEQL